MTPADLLKTADHAASKDDRWMFVALLIIGLLAIFFLARYFIAEIAKLQAEIVKVRSEFEGHLQRQNGEMIMALTKSTQVIEQNSEVLTDLRDIIKRS